MAFRKRNVALGQTREHVELDQPTDAGSPKSLPLGVRPSPLTAHLTTSTGTASLDSLLGGHAGLVLGSNLLIEESGTTDFAGALLRFYAAQGICHGHALHVVGAGDGWVRDLPGLVDESSRRSSRSSGVSDGDKMKIAWRYEGLAPVGERGAFVLSSLPNVPLIIKQIRQDETLNILHRLP